MALRIQVKSSILEVLSHRPFRFLWLGQILSQLALNSLLFILGLVVYQKTGSNAAVSALFLSYGIPAVIFGMVAGAIVDRLDRRAVLVACDFIRAILTLILVFLSWHVGAIYLIVFLNAIINQFYVPAEAPMIPRLIPRNYLVSANSLFSFTYFASMGVGFVIAGPLLRWFGPQNSLLITSAFFLLASSAVSRLPKQGEGLRTLARVLEYNVAYLLHRIFTTLADGIRYVSETPALQESLLLLTGTQVIVALLGSLGPGFADQVLQIDVRDSSWIIVAPTVAGIIAGALWVGNIGYQLGSKRLIRTGIIAAGSLLILISLTVKVSHSVSWIFPPNILIPFVFMLFLFLGVANALLDVPANSMLQERTSEDVRGRVYGILTASVGGLGILPIVIGGVLADVLGVGKVIFLLGVIILSYGIYRIRYNRL